jgi:hypothetical protein
MPQKKARWGLEMKMEGEVQAMLAEMRLVGMNENWRRGVDVVDWALRECSPRNPS